MTQRADLAWKTQSIRPPGWLCAAADLVRGELLVVVERVRRHPLHGRPADVDPFEELLARRIAIDSPTIGPTSYEVGDEMRAKFVVMDESANTAFAPARPGHWHCNLYTLARQRLNALGVTQLYGGDFDTFADPRFYSYRRDGARNGRFASLIWIK